MIRQEYTLPACVSLTHVDVIHGYKIAVSCTSFAFVLCQIQVGFGSCLLGLLYLSAGKVFSVFTNCSSIWSFELLLFITRTMLSIHCSSVVLDRVCFLLC